MGDVQSEQEVAFLVAEFDRAIDSWCVLHEMDAEAWTGNVAALLARRGALETLIAGWATADAAGDTLAARRLGWVFYQRGDTAGSEAAFRRAGQRGDPSAWLHLARVHRERGDQPAAEAARRNSKRAERELEDADRRADEQGDAEAAYRNGNRWETRARVLQFEQNYTGGPSNWRPIGQEESDALYAAEQAWRRAADRGSADGAYALARRRHHKEDEFEPADEEEIKDFRLQWETLFRRADELGHPNGAWQRGMILEDLDDLDGAEAAYRRADRRGSMYAVSALAMLLEKRGDLSGAETAYRRAADLDTPDLIGGRLDGVRALARFLERRGDLAGAEAALRQAIERGDHSARASLKMLYERHPTLRPSGHA